MKIEGYGYDIRTIHDWEDYLEWLDAHVSIQENRFVCKFNTEYQIPLSRCKTPTRVLIEAFTLVSHLDKNEPGANGFHVARRFIELVRKPMKLPHNLPEMFEELSQALEITPKARNHDETAG